MMQRVEFYLETTVEAFSSWLANYIRETAQGRQYPKGPGRLWLNPIQREHTLYSELMWVVPAAYTEGDRTPAMIPMAITFTVLPVGRGAEIEVRGMCHEPAVGSYFSEVARQIEAQWPSAEPVQPEPNSEDNAHVLAQLRLGATLDEFERELKHFGARYRAANVMSVRVDERRGYELSGGGHINRKGHEIDRKSERSWSVCLQLPPADQSTTGIRDIRVEVEATQLGSQYPLFMEVAVDGHLYRESFRFCEVFLAHCQGLWNSVPADFAYVVRRWQSEQTPAVSWPWPGLALSKPEPAVVFEPARLPAAPTQTAPKPAPPATVPPSDHRKPSLEDRAAPAVPAWEKVPDHLWDRQALKLWWHGRSCPAIGREIHQSAKTVLNRLSTLRKLYGTDVVPMNEQRRERDTASGYPG